MAGKLAKYRSKRDFEKTQEPSGDAKVRAAEYPRFVIQKHDATRLHYDLRLEHDGVFKSWAVTKGPSLDPTDKRLAVEVEDHPLDYGDFEGTIPKGEYGGGTVMLWDRGYWLPEGDENVDEALSKGELKFVLAGGKLQGSFVLVRMKHDRDGGKRNNWLLIKHKDEWAKPATARRSSTRTARSPRGARMEQIAAGKGKAPTPFMLGGKHGIQARRRLALAQEGRSRPCAAGCQAPRDAQASRRARHDKAKAAKRQRPRQPCSASPSPSPIRRCGRRMPASRRVTKLDLARYLKWWAVDARPHRGPAVLGHPRARRHRGRDVLPAPRHARARQHHRAREGGGRPRALHRDRPRRRADRHGAGRRPSNTIPGTASRSAPTFPGGWCSTSIRRRMSNSTQRDRGGEGDARAARSSGSRRLLQDDRRQGPARRHAAEARARASTLGWDDAKTFAQTLRADGRGQPRALPDQDDEEAAHGPHLPRLPAQRSFVDGGGAALAAGASRRAGVDAAHLGAGARRPRSGALQYPHRGEALAKSKAWEDYCDSQRPLHKAIERLVRLRAA